MDVGAFVQENRKWLLGVGGGALAWIVASAVFDAVHAVSGSRDAVRAGALYGGDARNAAVSEGEELAAARASLQQALEFRPGDKYRLDDKVKPGDFLFQASRDLKQGILTAANQRDVQVVETGITWEVPTGIDDIRMTLLGLELADELQARLFAAHDAVRAADETAMGLRSILALKLDARRNQRGPARAPRPGEFDVRDHLVQEQVTFQFQSDEATALGLLEALRSVPAGRTLVLESWQLLRPARPGEPCSIKGSLLGIVFKPKADAEGGE